MDSKNKSGPHSGSVDKIGKKQAAEAIHALREGINYHGHLCYAEDSPKVPDAPCDRLFRRFETPEKAIPALETRDLPGIRVGSGPVSKVKRIKQKNPLPGSADAPSITQPATSWISTIPEGRRRRNRSGEAWCMILLISWCRRDCALPRTGHAYQ